MAKDLAAMTDPIGPSRSAMLVAACRMLADEDPPGRRVCHDPYARLFVDDDAVVFARRNPALARVIQLRTRYIDDAIMAFASDHPQAQVVLLGAGNDARALRLDIDARFFEIDMPATVAQKAAVLESSGVVPPVKRTALPVDLATTRFVEPLLAAGFDVDAPTVVVWEGVTNYLDELALESTLAQIAEIVGRVGQLVVDYVRRRAFDRGFDGENTGIGAQLSTWGETLASGFADIVASLHAAGFVVLDESALEHLPPRYGLEPVVERSSPARFLTATPA